MPRVAFLHCHLLNPRSAQPAVSLPECPNFAVQRGDTATNTRDEQPETRDSLLAKRIEIWRPWIPVQRFDNPDRVHATALLADHVVVFRRPLPR
jgi:hypothetical protein